MLSYLYEIFETMPRQGPGTDADTRRALSLLAQLPEQPQVLDIGCGTGAQTLALAENLGGNIVAVDNYSPFLDTLRARARALSLSDRVTTRTASMFDLPFAAASFDLIWAEGAIYIIGFEGGLQAWRPLLRPGGYLVASEVVWRTPSPSREVAEFWQEEYLAITGVEANLATARACGYEVVGHFALPKAGWAENYYLPLEERIAKLRRKYAENLVAQKACDSLSREIDIFNRFGDCYGYEFFALRRKPR